jgi:hypothetical protein
MFAVDNNMSSADGVIPSAASGSPEVIDLTMSSPESPGVIGPIPTSPQIPQPAHPKATSHFRFLELPTEIRVLIYQELLVVGKVFFTPSRHEARREARLKDWQLYQKPVLKILRVCKFIHKEAEYEYLRWNLFVLPPDCEVQYPLLGYGPYRQLFNQSYHKDMFSSKAFSMVRNISLAVGPREHDWEHCHTIPHLLHNSGHTQSWSARQVNWLTIVRFVLTVLRRLHYVELDFSAAFCHAGCCHIPMHIVGRLATSVVSHCHGSDIRVVILGLDNNEAHVFRLDAGIQLWWQRSRPIPVGLLQAGAVGSVGQETPALLRWAEKAMTKFKVQFNPQQDRWARWKLEGPKEQA